MEASIQIIIVLGFGIACALIAQSRGRSAVGWFFIGLVAGCIGLIILLAISDLKVEQQKFSKLHSENMRLRERLKKDRQVADQRHTELTRRVGSHDRALGLDTASRDPILGPGDGPGVAGTLPLLSSSRFSSIDWYYVVEGEAKGPVTFSDLVALTTERLISDKSLVWHDGLVDWMSLSEVPGLSEELNG